MTDQTQDSRAAFEAYIKAEGIEYSAPEAFVTYNDGTYRNLDIHRKYLGWKAALEWRASAGADASVMSVGVSKLYWKARAEKAEAQLVAISSKEGALRAHCEGLLDIWDDGKYPEENRIYASNAFPLQLEEIREMLAKEED